MASSRKKTSLRLTEEILIKLRKEAQRLGISVNAYITMILSKEIK